MKKCDLCYEPNKIHYRVKSIIHKDWIFCCKECWNLISKHNMGYTAEANSGISFAHTIIKASQDTSIDDKASNALNLSRNDFERKKLADTLHQAILNVYEN